MALGRPAEHRAGIRRCRPFILSLGPSRLSLEGDLFTAVKRRREEESFFTDDEAMHWLLCIRKEAFPLRF